MFGMVLDQHVEGVEGNWKAVFPSSADQEVCSVFTYRVAGFIQYEFGSVFLAVRKPTVGMRFRITFPNGSFNARVSSVTYQGMGLGS